MTRLWLLAAALAVLPAPSASQSAPEPKSLQDLSGLWAAKKWFGPEVRGTLIVIHHGIWHCGQPNRTDRARTMFKVRLGPSGKQLRSWDVTDLDDPDVRLATTVDLHHVVGLSLVVIALLRYSPRRATMCGTVRRSSLTSSHSDQFAT